MFESRIPAGATERLPGWEKPHAKTVAWSCDMEGHAQKVRRAMLRPGKQEGGAIFTKFLVLAWMTINPNKKNLNQLENCHKFAHKLY